MNNSIEIKNVSLAMSLVITVKGLQLLQLLRVNVSERFIFVFVQILDELLTPLHYLSFVLSFLLSYFPVGFFFRHREQSVVLLSDQVSHSVDHFLLFRQLLAPFFELYGDFLRSF